MFFALRLKNAMVMLQITKSSTRQNPSLHLKRCLSATDIFTPLKHSPADQLLQTQPKMVPELSVGDLYASGQSVLHDLDLFWPISPSSWVRLGLESLHNFSEIPWWLTFLISGILSRLLVSAIVNWRFNHVLKSPTLMDEYNHLVKEAERAKKGSKHPIRNFKKPEFMTDAPHRKFRRFACYVGMINFTVHYFALSGMARANFPGFATEGALWFTNLSIPDPIFLLPAITASTFFLANLHWNNEDRAEVKVAIASDSRIKYMFGIAKYAPPVVIFTVAAYMPSAICLHWASSNATHLARELLYKSETIKRLTSAPDLRRFKEKEHGVVSSHHEFMDGDSLNRPDLSKEVR